MSLKPVCYGFSFINLLWNQKIVLPRNALQRLFSHSRLKGFFHSKGIVPGKAGNSSASGFLNRAVNI